MNLFKKMIILAALVLVFLNSSDLKAEEKLDQKAKEAFANGKELFEKGQYAAASTQFQVAYRHKPSWRLFYNIGQSEAGARRYGLALEAFERYLVEAGDDITSERRNEVHEEVERLRNIVGMLNIKGPAGADIFVNGVKRGVLPLSGYVPVSAAVEHTVSGMLEGKKLSTRKVKIMAAQVFDVNLELVSSSVVLKKDGETEAIPKSASGDEAEYLLTDDEAPSDIFVKLGTSGTPREGRALSIISITAMGSGAAMLLTSGFLMVAAKKKDNEIKKHCLEGFEDVFADCVVSLEYRDIYNKRENLRKASLIFLISGGAVAVTGGVLFTIARAKKKSNRPVSFIPLLDPEFAGGVLNWYF